MITSSVLRSFLLTSIVCFPGLALAAGVSDYAEEHVSYTAELDEAKGLVKAGTGSRATRPGSSGLRAELGLDSLLNSRVRAQNSWLRCTDALSAGRPDALATCRRAARLDPKNPYIWNSIGRLHEQARKRARAEKAYATMLKLAVRQDNPTAQIIGLSNLANLSVSRKQCGKAMVFTQKAATIAKSNALLEWLPPALNTEAACLSQRGKFEPARQKLKTALKLAKRFEREPQLALTYVNIGKLEKRSGQLAKAESAYKKALALYMKTGADRFVAENFYRLAHIAVLKRDFPVAENYLVSSLKHYRAVGHERGVALVGRLITHLAKLRPRGEARVTEKQASKPAGDLKSWNRQRRKREYRIDGSATMLLDAGHRQSE